ncbi:MAG: response regulator [Candidatus Promineifilaceae bacterium]|nr:response regulator [Candidatus Promineifilaceae bacterium]
MRTVIVVDDDVSTSNLLRMLLEMEGFDVLVSDDGERGLAVMPPDTAAFLIDCHLAGQRSGLDLVRTVRNGEAGVDPTIPLVVVSGDERLKGAAIDAGADIFMLKPYSPHKLMEQIHRLVGTDRESTRS